MTSLDADPLESGFRCARCLRRIDPNDDAVAFLKAMVGIAFVAALVAVGLGIVACVLVARLMGAT